MKNPLQYFEDLLSSDQSESKKQSMISNFIKDWGNYGDVSIDNENGIIKQTISTFDENTKTWSTDTGVLIFENHFQQEIDKEYTKTIKLLSEQILDISSQSLSPEIFINQIKGKISILKGKANQYYNTYPFVKEIICKIDEYINEYSTDSSTKEVLNISDSSTVAIPVITNYSALSFKWDLLNPDDIENELSRLYELLTENPPLIFCDKQDFINGFSQREVIAGVNWMVMSKNRTCSKSSLIYLLLQLIENCDLMDEPNDFNKKVEYVFRDNLGQTLSNIKQSKSQLSDNPAQKERIDEIIEKFLQG